MSSYIDADAADALIRNGTALPDENGRSASSRVLTPEEIDALLGLGNHANPVPEPAVAHTGWVCPVCGAGVRPDLARCDHGGGT